MSYRSGLHPSLDADNQRLPHTYSGSRKKRKPRRLKRDFIYLAWCDRCEARWEPRICGRGKHPKRHRYAYLGRRVPKQVEEDLR